MLSFQYFAPKGHQAGPAVSSSRHAETSTSGHTFDIDEVTPTCSLGSCFLPKRAQFRPPTPQSLNRAVSPSPNAFTVRRSVTTTAASIASSGTGAGASPFPAWPELVTECPLHIPSPCPSSPQSPISRRPSASSHCSSPPRSPSAPAVCRQQQQAASVAKEDPESAGPAPRGKSSSFFGISRLRGLRLWPSRAFSGRGSVASRASVPSTLSPSLPPPAVLPGDPSQGTDNPTSPRPEPRRGMEGKRRLRPARSSSNAGTYGNVSGNGVSSGSAASAARNCNNSTSLGPSNAKGVSMLQPGSAAARAAAGFLGGSWPASQGGTQEQPLSSDRASISAVVVATTAIHAVPSPSMTSLTPSALLLGGEGKGSHQLPPGWPALLPAIQNLPKSFVDLEDEDEPPDKDSAGAAPPSTEVADSDAGSRSTAAALGASVLALQREAQAIQRLRSYAEGPNATGTSSSQNANGRGNTTNDRPGADKGSGAAMAAQTSSRNSSSRRSSGSSSVKRAMASSASNTAIAGANLSAPLQDSGTAGVRQSWRGMFPKRSTSADTPRQSLKLHPGRGSAPAAANPTPPYFRSPMRRGPAACTPAAESTAAAPAIREVLSLGAAGPARPPASAASAGALSSSPRRSPGRETAPPPRGMGPMYRPLHSTDLGRRLVAHACTNADLGGAATVLVPTPRARPAGLAVGQTGQAPRHESVGPVGAAQVAAEHQQQQGLGALWSKLLGGLKWEWSWEEWVLALGLVAVAVGWVVTLASGASMGAAPPHGAPSMYQSRPGAAWHQPGQEAQLAAVSRTPEVPYHLKEARPGVLELTPSTLPGALRQRPTFVMFYAPWCPYCQRMDGAWMQLAHKLADSGHNVQVARVDAYQYSDIARKYSIPGFPTLMLFDGEAPVAIHRGRRDVATLFDFVIRQLAGEGAKSPVVRGGK